MDTKLSSVFTVKCPCHKSFYRETKARLSITRNKCEGIRGPREKKGSIFNSIMKHLKSKSNHDLLHELFHEYFMNLYPSMVGTYVEDQKEYQKKIRRYVKTLRSSYPQILLVLSNI